MAKWKAARAWIEEHADRYEFMGSVAEELAEDGTVSARALERECKAAFGGGVPHRVAPEVFRLLADDYGVPMETRRERHEPTTA